MKVREARRIISSRFIDPYFWEAVRVKRQANKMERQNKKVGRRQRKKHRG